MRSNAKIARRKVSKFRDEIERESIERGIETNSWHQCTSVCSRRSFMREWNRNRESCGVGRDYSRPTGTSHFRRSARVKLSWLCAAWKILSRSIDHRELVWAGSLLFPTSLSLFNAHWREHSFPFSTKFCAGKFGSTLNWTQFRRLKALIGKVISNHDVKCDVHRETD